MMTSSSTSREHWINAVFGNVFKFNELPAQNGRGEAFQTLETNSQYTTYTSTITRKSSKKPLGLSLVSMPIGLVVSKVHHGSEADIAGMREGMLLVSVNGVGLLCEISHVALEFLWVHGLTSRQRVCSDRNTLLQVQCYDPTIEKTIIIHLYTSLGGMEWASCGDFTVVSNTQHPKLVKKGSLLLSIDKETTLNFRQSTTRDFVQYLSNREIATLELTLGYTPMAGRLNADHKKQRDEAQNYSISSLACASTSPMSSKSLDQIAQNVASHDIFKQLRILAFKVIQKKIENYPSDEFLSQMTRKARSQASPWPSKFQFSLDNFDIDGALRFNLTYYSRKFNEEEVTDIQSLSSVPFDSRNFPRNAVFSHLLELVSAGYSGSSTSQRISHIINSISGNESAKENKNEFWSNLELIGSRILKVPKASRSKALRDELKKIKFRPIINPLKDDEQLVRIKIDECHALPSTHAPLLLSFETKRPNVAAEIAEVIYELNISVLGLVAKRMKKTNQSFRVAGYCSGFRDELNEMNNCVQVSDGVYNWYDNTLSFRVKSCATAASIKISSVLKNGEKKETPVGDCWIDLRPIWEKLWKQVSSSLQKDNSVSVTTYAQLWSPATNESTEDSESTLPEPLTQRVELELWISLKPAGRESKKSIHSTRLLYKHGDDIRQEYFCIEMLKKLKLLLASNGLDYGIRTFDCIPLSLKTGVIEWVNDSVPLSNFCKDDGVDIIDWLFNYVGGEVRKENDSILYYLRDAAYDPSAPCWIDRKVMKQLIQSAAGYSLLTYILGVGDRHTDNLLLTPDGTFFHCDFSFLMGSDPKTYIPMRLPSMIIRAMGGVNSDEYQKFQSLVAAGFLTLRRTLNVRYLCNSLVLVKDAELPDITGLRSNNNNSKRNAGKAIEILGSTSGTDVEEVLLNLRNRLRLDLDDVEALNFIEMLSNECINSKKWIAVDTLHSLGKRF